MSMLWVWWERWGSKMTDQTDSQLHPTIPTHLSNSVRFSSGKNSVTIVFPGWILHSDHWLGGPLCVCREIFTHPTIKSELSMFVFCICTCMFNASAVKVMLTALSCVWPACLFHCQTHHNVWPHVCQQTFSIEVVAKKKQLPNYLIVKWLKNTSFMQFSSLALEAFALHLQFSIQKH